MNHTPMNNTPIPSRSTAWLVRTPSYSYYVLVHESRIEPDILLSSEEPPVN